MQSDRILLGLMLALAASLTLFAAPATATEFAVNVSGTLEPCGPDCSNEDGDNLFGLAGKSLDGDTFDLTLVYDTSKGVLTTYDGGPTDMIYTLDGGSAYGDSSPAVSALLSVNGGPLSIRTSELMMPPSSAEITALISLII